MKKINYVKGETRAWHINWKLLLEHSNYPEALEHYLQSLKICEQFDNKRRISANLGNTWKCYIYPWEISERH